ncbi:carbonic anhydrase [Streptomyces scabichelini]|uniref:carbonic anhydrase n=1 Tax=Streptomyces scabichelini TaxID=2711217 RepID=UPI0030BA01EB
MCGHSHCGAVQRTMREQNVQTMPLVRHWLSRATPRPDRRAVADPRDRRGPGRRDPAARTHSA